MNRLLTRAVLLSLGTLAFAGCEAGPDEEAIGQSSDQLLGGLLIDRLPIDKRVSMPGLGNGVDVVQDDRGMWHIYAAKTNDALRVEGYLMARDRMGQMEFIRRTANGRLAELGGSMDPSLIEMDV